MDPSTVKQPASAGPDAKYPSVLVIQYTLKTLNDEGYINANVTDQMPSLKYFPGPGALLRLEERQRLLAADPNPDQVGEGQLRKDEPHHIHPCLQRMQWAGIDARDWEAILPSVELASRFLDDPCITPFFRGLDNATVQNDPLLKMVHGNIKFHRFDTDNSVMGSEAELRKAFLAMMSMRESVQFQFSDQGDDDAATDWSGSHKLAIVNINQKFLYILRQDPGWNPQRWSRSWAPGTHEPSARWRTRVQLAIALVHELTHCAWYIQCKGEQLAEPYLRDRPINELGWELENFIWTGIIEPSVRGRHMSSPYGLRIERFPGYYQFTDPHRQLYTRGEPRDWGVTWTTQYPIAMDWCRGLFTEEFWDEVSRYGFIHVRPSRIKGVRLRVSSKPKVRVGDDTMSPRTRALLQYREDRRVKAMEAGVKADNIDSSDEEDVGRDSIVVRGRHKEEMRKQRGDGDTEMPDA